MLRNIDFMSWKLTGLEMDRKKQMLYIRADMNEVIATGHIMRCLAIADAARELGRDTTFILADTQAVELIRERGHRSIVLDTGWNQMDMELPALKKVIAECGIRKLLVDSYSVTSEYLQALSEQVEVAYIDDLDSFIYPVHTLIRYTGNWEESAYEERYRETKLLLGLEYAPLRRAFANCSQKVIPPRAENLLLLSGGTDRFYVIESLLKEIRKEQYKSIDVICGKYYEDYTQMCAHYHQYENIHFHQGINNVEDYMKKADVAVSAGGTTLYELSACGTPTISYSFADNQLDNVKRFQKDNLISYAGDVRYDKAIEKILHDLDLYMENMPLRMQQSRRMQALIDGKGALRIAKIL